MSVSPARSGLRAVPRPAEPHASTGLDSYDVRILEELQADASRSLAEIGEAVNLSQNACWRRIRRLESDGYINGRVALVNAERVGLGVTVFVTIRTAEHSEEYLTALSRAVSAIPEVVEFYRTSGELDYLLKLRVADISSYDRVYRKLIRSVRIADVSASFAMEAIKETTAVPVRFAPSC